MGKKAKNYEAPDPLYEQHVETGKRQRRPLPEGLTKEEAKVCLSPVLPTAVNVSVLIPEPRRSYYG